MRRPLPPRAVLSLVPLLIGPPLLAQGAWTKAPAVPTACYSDQDTFGAEVEKALSELEEASRQQRETNRALLNQIFEMDPATLQQRLMAAVQKNPAKAQEIMQAMQNLGTAENQGDRLETLTGQGGFEDKKTKLKADYNADREAVLGPSAEWAKQHQTEAGLSPEARAINRAAWAEYNKKYETVLCPRWFGQEFPAVAGQYRDFLVDEAIPKRAEAEATAGRQLELFGVPSKGYQPVAEMDGVVAYLRFVADLYSQRQSAPTWP